MYFVPSPDCLIKARKLIDDGNHEKALQLMKFIETQENQILERE